MKASKSVVSGILGSYVDKSKVEEASTAVMKGLEVKERCSEISKLMQEEETRHHQTIEGYKKRIEEIRKECGHWVTTFHPDPSGNNDSYHECSLCGKYL